MSYSLFAFYEAPVTQTPIFADDFREAVARRPQTHSRPVAIELFLPEPEPVVLFDDGPAPAAILEFTCHSFAALEGLLNEAWFRRRFLTVPLERQPTSSISFGAFRAQPSAVAGTDDVQPRKAGLSFIVRYYGPMADEAAFHDFYTANHPPILGRLPNVRNVCCYLPEKLRDFELPHSEVRFINEVVFDDVGNLNAALQSDVIGLLKADSARFPPYGHSTHHAMRRETLLSAGEA